VSTVSSIPCSGTYRANFAARCTPPPPIGGKWYATKSTFVIAGRSGLLDRIGHPLGGNPGDVWQLATAAFHGEHWATFPKQLIERPILSTCPERTCVACGRPWLRARQFIHDRWLQVGSLQPDCNCQANWQPGVVLDPFCGAATTALVAEQHGRDWLGIELSPKFAELAEARLARWRESKRGDAG